MIKRYFTQYSAAIETPWLFHPSSFIQCIKYNRIEGLLFVKIKNEDYIYSCTMDLADRFSLSPSWGRFYNNYIKHRDLVELPQQRLDSPGEQHSILNPPSVEETVDYFKDPDNWIPDTPKEMAGIGIDVAMMYMLGRNLTPIAKMMFPVYGRGLVVLGLGGMSGKLAMGILKAGIVAAASSLDALLEAQGLKSPTLLNYSFAFGMGFEIKTKLQAAKISEFTVKTPVAKVFAKMNAPGSVGIKLEQAQIAKVAGSMTSSFETKIRMAKVRSEGIFKQHPELYAPYKKAWESVFAPVEKNVFRRGAIPRTVLETGITYIPVSMLSRTYVHYVSDNEKKKK